jgi:hypothetical protein
MLVGFGYAYLRRHGFALNSLNFLYPPNGPGVHMKGRNQAAPYNPTFRWPVLWATLVILVALGAYLLWRRSRAVPAAAPSADETVADAFAASIDGALDDLENEPDPRRAVIAAYARMEGVLARKGLSRNQSETPLEYLQRILLGLTSRSDAVTLLTGLFERAKFSRHEIDGNMKHDAIDALRAIRDDLQPAEA